ncbi:hypothetical protein [Collimonas sp.]|uniref:hypothetical protein n=1 Tax=Collimonas sp. TaxID=1963772 RepID=UPI002C6341F3|nr:hypothetical protein [Collimonas sp.]HWW07207.1 hypothetical protein [Collimonas sp.]
MKRFAILLGLAVLLSGCVVDPYGSGYGGYRDGGYRDGGDRHEHHDDRGGEHRRDDNPNRY